VIKLIASITFAANLAFAHGEDKPGPNGGHIRMPGNFHTEVIADKDGSFHVYLLDIQFQNPTIKNSEVKAHIISGKGKTKLKCKPMGTHFHCKGGTPARKGSLVLKAKRSGVIAGTDAKYPLPFPTLAENKSEPSSTDHSNH
jgi:hypothetical protein